MEQKRGTKAGPGKMSGTEAESKSGIEIAGGGETEIETTVSVLVCTEDAALRDRLQRLLARWAESDCVSISLHCSSNLKEAQVCNSLLILDVDTVDGVKLFSHWETGFPAACIVISGDAVWAIRAYRLRSSAFLSRSFGYLELREALGTCFSAWKAGRIWLTISWRWRQSRLWQGELLYVEADGHNCVLHCKNTLISAHSGIEALAQRLCTPPFFRCHRCFIVHIPSVIQETYTHLLLADGQIVPMGRRHQKAASRELARWKEIVKNGDFSSDL